MAFWDADLSTRMGAQSAADQGGLACFVSAGLAVVGALFFGGLMGFDTPEGIAVAALTAVEVALSVIAGIRLRMGKGAYWAMAVAALLGLQLLLKLVTLQIGAGIIFNVIILVFVVQGIRGALALRAGNVFEEDAMEAFE